jgi:epsin
MLSQGMTFESLVAASSNLTQSPVIQPSSASGYSTPSNNNNTPAKNNTTNDNKPIGGIWSQASNLVSLDSLGKKTEAAKPAQGPSMNSLKNSSVNAGWNDWATQNPSTTQQQPQQQQTKQSSAFDDLLF